VVGFESTRMSHGIVCIISNICGTPMVIEAMMYCVVVEKTCNVMCDMVGAFSLLKGQEDYSAPCTKRVDLDQNPPG
jgi:hypothetical protein